MHGPACTTVTGTTVPLSSYTRVIPTLRPRIAAINPLPFSLMAFLTPQPPPKTRILQRRGVRFHRDIPSGLVCPAKIARHRSPAQNRDPYSAIVVSRPSFSPGKPGCDRETSPFQARSGSLRLGNPWTINCSCLTPESVIHIISTPQNTLSRKCKTGELSKHTPLCQTPRSEPAALARAPSHPPAQWQVRRAGGHCSPRIRTVTSHILSH